MSSALAIPMNRVVADLMSAPVESIGPNDSLATALDVMMSRNIRHLPVVEDGLLRGLITERDVMRHALAETGIEDQRAYLGAMKVEDVMTLHPQTVVPGTRLEVAAKIMTTLKYGCVPVVEQMKLVGILTEADFVKEYLP